MDLRGKSNCRGALNLVYKKDESSLLIFFVLDKLLKKKDPGCACATGVVPSGGSATVGTEQ
jgi:hypothetical protein